MTSMIEQYDNILNCKEHLREKLPILIEAFVSFYGEERRQEIEEKFSKAIFIAYRTPESTQSYLHKISSLLTDEIVQKAIDEESSSYTLEELLNKTSFEYASIVPIHHYSTFLELYELGEEGRIERFKEKALNELHQYLPELTKEEYEKMIQTQSLLSKYEMIRPIVKNNLLYYLDLSHADTMMEREFNQSKALIQSIDPSITLETFSYFYDNERLKDLNRIAHKYPELVEEYIQRMSKYDSYNNSMTIDKPQYQI